MYTFSECYNVNINNCLHFQAEFAINLSISFWENNRIYPTVVCTLQQCGYSEGTVRSTPSTPGHCLNLSML